MPEPMLHFSEIAKTTKVVGAMARLIVERLTFAGEIYLYMQSGRYHIIHLGDKGELTENTLTYRDKKGQTHVVLLANVEEIKNHLGEAS